MTARYCIKNKKTSGQCNLTQGRIAAARGSFSHSANVHDRRLIHSTSLHAHKSTPSDISVRLDRFASKIAGLQLNVVPSTQTGRARNVRHA